MNSGVWSSLEFSLHVFIFDVSQFHRDVKINHFRMFEWMSTNLGTDFLINRIILDYIFAKRTKQKKTEFSSWIMVFRCMNSFGIYICVSFFFHNLYRNGVIGFSPDSVKYHVIYFIERQLCVTDSHSKYLKWNGAHWNVHPEMSLSFQYMISKPKFNEIAAFIRLI